MKNLLQVGTSFAAMSATPNIIPDELVDAGVRLVIAIVTALIVNIADKWLKKRKNQ